MNEQLAELLTDLADKQVGFYVAHDAPFGQSTVHLSAQEIVRYAADPVGFLAGHYGVSRENYLGWHRSGYKVICTGFTKSGKPCKATITGLSNVTNPKDWVRGQGARCFVHG